MHTHTVALVGAGGKMGLRTARNLRGRPDWSLRCVEISEQGKARLADLGLAAEPLESALAAADFVVLAVPDARVRTVSSDVVPRARPGTTFLLLDPAAAMAQEVALRSDAHFVVAHPCHPPLFGTRPEADGTMDFFGGVSAPQDVVIAPLQSDEPRLAAAANLCRAVFAPVGTVHRITVEQMAILEPAMAEVCAACAAALMKDALEEAVRRGVPRPAATAFMMGHAQIPLAIVFGAIGSPFSDAAKIAIDYGRRHLLRDDWRKVFEPEQVRACIQEMLHPEEPRP